MAPLALLAAASWAGLQPAREPLPAREVERPIVLPLGWTEIGVGGGGSEAAIEGRHGALRGASVGAGLAWRDGRLDSTRIFGELSLIWREPPALAWAAELGWTQPWLGAGAAEGMLRIRRAFGPFRAECAGGAALSVGRLSPLGDAALLLQAGPLWVEGRAEIAAEAELRSTATLALQLARGVAFGGSVRLDAPIAGVWGSVWL